MSLGNQPTNKPTRKVISSTTWGAVAAILAWVDDAFFSNFVPGYIEAAIIVLAIAAAGYFTRNASPDAPPAPLVAPEAEVGD